MSAKLQSATKVASLFAAVKMLSGVTHKSHLYHQRALLTTESHFPDAPHESEVCNTMVEQQQSLQMVFHCETQMYKYSCSEMEFPLS